MKVIILLFSIFGLTAGLFGLFEGTKTTTTTTTTTPKPKLSLGKEVLIPPAEKNDGSEITIPLNDPPKTTTKSTTAKTTTTVKVSTITPRIVVGDERVATTTINPKFTLGPKTLPSSDRHSSSECPNRIDAFTSAPDHDYAFYDKTVYIIDNNRIKESVPISQQFPNGPQNSVNGASYDIERQVLILIEDKEVYGYKFEGGSWKLQSVFPKTLPSSIPFTPNAAVRWHNKHQLLLSNGGKFALYDQYWNKSLTSGRTDSYFENLPDRVKGISEWINGRAYVFTQSLVFEYHEDKKSTVGDGKPLGDFWRC